MSDKQQDADKVRELYDGILVLLSGHEAGHCLDALSSVMASIACQAFPEKDRAKLIAFEFGAKTALLVEAAHADYRQDMKNEPSGSRDLAHPVGNA